MKVAIMQPYLFPYIGYFKLINQVDVFVVFDDVNYIKKGWINKNQILANKRPWKFTFPVTNASQNRLIKDHLYNDLIGTQTKFLKSIEAAYKTSPHYENLLQLIKTCFSDKTLSVSEFNLNCLKHVCRYIGIETKFVNSSELAIPKVSTAEQRLIDITLALSGKVYLNLPGGKALYNHSEFEKQGLELEFIDNATKEYHQESKEFHPYMSILDVIANNEQKELINLL